MIRWLEVRLPEKKDFGQNTAFLGSKAEPIFFGNKTEARLMLFFVKFLRLVKFLDIYDRELQGRFNDCVIAYRRRGNCRFSRIFRGCGIFFGASVKSDEEN